MAVEEGKSLEETVKELKKANKKLDLLVDKTPEADTGATATEIARENQAREVKQTILLEQMAKGISNLYKSFLESVKEKGKMGLGIIIAAIAAPIITLVTFFKQLAMEFKFLKALTGKGLTKLFAPLKALFGGEGPLGKAFASFNRMIKGIRTAITGSKTFKVISEIGDKFKSVLTRLGKFFAPIGRFFKSIFDLSKNLIKMTARATGIVEFAAGFGRILGKIFLPITLLISAFDFITGFMVGYKEGGIIGGLKGGLTKLFQGLIGMPLDLLKSAVSWILGKFGFKNAEKTLDAFSFKKLIADIIGSMFSMISKAVDWVKLLFKDPVAALKVLWKGLLGTFKSVAGILMAPVDKAINWVMDLFGWGDPKKEFSISTFLFGKPGGIVTKAIDWVKSIFSWGEKAGKTDKGFSLALMISKALNKLKEFFWAKDGKSGILQFSMGDALDFEMPSFSNMINSVVKSIFPTDLFDTWYGKYIKKALPDSLIEMLNDPVKAGALGGRMSKGQPMLVGEMGPELILPSGGGEVVTAGRTQQMMQASIQKSLDQLAPAGGNGGMSNVGNTVVTDAHTETTMVNSGVSIRRPIILGKS